MTQLSRPKAPSAFRTITEAADEIGVPAHVLRFWESRFTALRPMKRAGGRRLYRTDDMALLRGLKTLLHDDGYTIKGVQKLLKDNGIAWVRDAGHGQVSDQHGVRSVDSLPWDDADESGGHDEFGDALGDIGAQVRTLSATEPATDTASLRAVLARLQAANRRIEAVLAA